MSQLVQHSADETARGVPITTLPSPEEFRATSAGFHATGISIYAARAFAITALAIPPAEVAAAIHERSALGVAILAAGNRQPQ